MTAGAASSDDRADRVAAWATGSGVGAGVFMIAWLIGGRVASVFWAPPTGPVVAMAVAVSLGLITTVLAGWRLSRRLRSG